MSIYSNVKIAQAASDYSKIDLSSDTLMTFDFGQMAVVNVIDNIIGDKIKYDYRLFGRMAPLVFPTYGEFGQRVISCFVPYYLIADDADSYISGITYHGGRRAVGRFFYQKMLDIMFYGPFYNSTGGASGATWDFLRLMNETEINSYQNLLPQNRPLSVFTVETVNGDIFYYRLTSLGKQIYKLFRSLGYTINRKLVFDPSSSSVGSQNANVTLNAYPLLCYLKAYADLILPTAFYQTSPLLSMLASIKSGNTNFMDALGYLSLDKMREQIKSTLRVYYDSDYFTTAWQSTNSPLSTSSASVGSFEDANNIVDMVADTENTRLDLTRSNHTLSQTQLRFLRGFDSFVRRNNLVGYREFNAVYARFGLKPSEMRSNYTQIIDVRNIPVNVGDVTSTADTGDTVLGSYAGKAFQSGDTSFEYEAKDFGMFLQITSLYVKPMYFKGTRKHCLRKNAFDFYQPEFDGVGPAAISRLEVDGSLDDTVFGFTERYNDYRFQQSNILGDFELDPLMYAWHTGRSSFGVQPTAQTDNMLVYQTDNLGNSEYDRMFSVDSSVYPLDHFYQTWQFKVSAFRKIKNINAALDLGVGNIQLDRNGAV